MVTYLSKCAILSISLVQAESLVNWTSLKQLLHHTLLLVSRCIHFSKNRTLHFLFEGILKLINLLDQLAVLHKLFFVEAEHLLVLLFPHMIFHSSLACLFLKALNQAVFPESAFECAPSVLKPSLGFFADVGFLRFEQDLVNLLDFLFGGHVARHSVIVDGSY